MASGHVNRIYRPNTWLHRPSLRRENFPCQPGAVHTWALNRRWCFGKCRYTSESDTRCQLPIVQMLCRVHGKSNPGIWAAANGPDGQISKILSSPSAKNIFVFVLPKSAAYPSLSRPTRGAIARRHERGAGCGGRKGVRRANSNRRAR
jgi:hypothetical protein